MKLSISILLCFLFFSCQGEAQKKSESSATSAESEAANSEFPYVLTESEWKEKLSPAAFQVLRKEATERAFTSELLEEKRQGVYTCAGCGEPLFKSEHKFDSGTGWPSFDRAIEGKVSYSTDYKIGVARTEEHCSNCGGHLGHVFDDGPSETTGKRHCINGVALNFMPNE